MDKPAHAKKRAQRRRLKNCRLWELMLSDVLRDRCCATGRVRQTSASHDPDARIRVPNPVRACRQRVCRHLLPGPDALRQRRLNFWRQREAMALSLVLLGASLAMSATAIATKDAQARGRSGEAELPS